MWANGWRGKAELIRDEVLPDAVIAVAIGVRQVGQQQANGSQPDDSEKSLHDHTYLPSLIVGRSGIVRASRPTITACMDFVDHVDLQPVYAVHQVHGLHAGKNFSSSFR